MKRPLRALAKQLGLVESGALMYPVAFPVVELEQLRFRWPGGPPLLEVLHLEVGDRERVFVHGPSGSGKSTLIGLIAGIHVPERGIIRVLGRELSSLRPGDRDRMRGTDLGIVFQQFNLVPYLSTVDNVLLPLTFSSTRRKRCGTREEARGQARDLLRRLGIEAALDGRLPTALSVGQQQRVAVARALIGRPRLVICDEPTSALDADARDSFLDVLLAEVDRVGSAILFVSHDMGLARHFDRLVDMGSLGGAA